LGGVGGAAPQYEVRGKERKKLGRETGKIGGGKRRKMKELLEGAGNPGFWSWALRWESTKPTLRKL